VSSEIQNSSPNPSLAIVGDLFQRIIGPFAATNVSLLLHEPDNIEERIKLLLDTFHANPNLIAPFRTLIKSINKQETEVTLEEQIRFYQTKHTRAWLIVNLFNQVLNLKELKLDETTGRLPGKPNDLLKYAHQAQLAFGEESRYKDPLFAVGLIFDFILYLQRTPMLDLGQTKFDEPINQAFTKSVEQAKIITKLSRHKSKLALEKLTPLTAFLRQLSQVSLMVLRPTQAPDFYKKLATLKHTEIIRLSLEMKTFGVHTGIIAAYLGQSLPIFEALGEAMSVWSAPYLSWLNSRKDVHDLAGMGELGVAMNEFVKVSDFGSSGRASVGLPELEYLDFAINAGMLK
jgi:hypothetical protein